MAPSASRSRFPPTSPKAPCRWSVTSMTGTRSPTRSAAVTVPVGSTLHFRYLAEGGRWFDDESLPAPEGQDVAITV